MELLAGSMQVTVDEKSGCITSIKDTTDDHEMDWVLADSQWGKIEGFPEGCVEAIEGSSGIKVRIKKHELEVEVLRVVENGRLKEVYTFRNVSDCDYFITQESFGIHFPFNCVQERGTAAEVLYYGRCNAHVWCGDNICWIYGTKVCGEAPYLVINMTEGAISDYSIIRDVARVRIGADYRGDVVLNPACQVIAPGESARYCFEYWLSKEHPRQALAKEPDFIMASADLYTPDKGSVVNLAVEYHGNEEIKVFLEGEPVETVRKDSFYQWSYKAEDLGEKVFDIYAGKKRTYLKLFVTETLDVLMERRAHFIAKKQQFIKPGSPLDGAYLIYDNVEKCTYYNSFGDHNAARERIVMGILIARQLQKKYDEDLMQSLKRNLVFMKRELYDAETATVYNDVGKNNKQHRIYNYSWLSLYFQECYNLTGEREYLEHAARIMIRYYELDGAKQDSPCIEAVELIYLLEHANCIELKNLVLKGFLDHADSILQRRIGSFSEEVTVTNGSTSNKGTYLLQAYCLTGDKKYLTDIELHRKSAEAFFSFQPEYHFNGIAIRHWDAFWFGKKKQYGDTFPHYWSYQGGWMYYWYEKVLGENCRKEYENILRNNLCIYSPDGAAANSYLSPYKVTLFSSVKEYQNPTMPQGAFYGKTYDEWANDQDWVLYYADKLLNTKSAIFSEET